MDIHHQAPSEVVITDMSPTYSNGVEAIKGMTKPECLPVTIHYNTFRLPGNQVDGILTADQRLAALKSEAQAKATADNEEAEAAFAECKHFYHVDPNEWDASEAQWREWVAKREPGSAALESGVLHVRVNDTALWRQKEMDGAVAEARFSQVLQPQHGDKCLVCQEVQVTEEDAMLSDADKHRRNARLTHQTRRLQPTSSAAGFDPATGSRDRAEELLQELNASTWGYEQAGPVQKKPTPSIMQTLENAFPNPEILGLEPGSWTELSDGREFLDAAKQLLQSTDDSAMMFDPTLLQRARVFGQNKQTVENAIDRSDSLKSLSAADKKSVAKVTAEAWELERDVVKLENIQKALRARIEWAKKRYSVNGYDAQATKMQRENYASVESHASRYGRLGSARGNSVDHENEEEKDAKDKGENEYVAAERTSTEMEKASQLQIQPPLEASAQSEAIELNTEPKCSPSLLSPANSERPAQSACSPSMFLDTLHSSHKHSLEAAHDDGKSPWVEGGTFKYEVEQQTPPLTGEAAPSGNDIPKVNASNGKAKKDSRVEELIAEDGVIPKDFAAKSNIKKATGLRKLSIRAGSSRLTWR